MISGNNLKQNLINSRKMKDLKFYKENCKEDYLHTPISVLRYISELEKRAENKPLIIKNIVCSALTHLVEPLNKRLIHPEKDADLLMEELQEIGVYHADDKGWYIDID